MERLLFAIMFLAALGSGLIAGLFFVFSITVMAALHRLAPVIGISAMQSINVTILSPVFLSVFMGTAVLCALLLIVVFTRLSTPGAGFVVIGAAFYLIGVIGVTMLFNVPLNRVLAAMDPQNTNAAKLWTGYVSVWNGWNHVRTVSALSTLTSFILAIRAWPAPI